MYFLSDEERRYLSRRLLPQARRHSVAEELRGWHWDKPPLEPVYAALLGVAEVAGQYCPTGRDLYLRHVLGVKPEPNAAMQEGAVLHDSLARLIVAAKRCIYEYGSECLPYLEALSEPDCRCLSKAPSLGGAERAAVREKVERLWRWEQQRIVVRVQEALARQPGSGPDGLVQLALPVVVEQRLDGTFLGLSPHLAVDGVTLPEPMVVELQFGHKEPFHRLATTGYALVLEALYEMPVDVGCVTYVSFSNGVIRIERDLHLIDDELRQEFLDARDERARIVEQEVDPGLPVMCPLTCPYYRHCHPGEGPMALLRKSGDGQTGSMQNGAL